jgi:hypothetical protein
VVLEAGAVPPTQVELVLQVLLVVPFQVMPVWADTKGVAKRAVRISRKKTTGLKDLRAGKLSFV